MTVNVEAAVRTVVDGVSIKLDSYDAKVLRFFLGGTHRDERREAVKRNGGDQMMQDRARHLVKEIIDAIDAAASGLAPAARPSIQPDPEDDFEAEEEEEQEQSDSIDDDFQY